MAIDVTLSNFAVDGAARPDSFSRMDTRFSTALADMLAAAPPEIQSKLRISSGYRSVERQTQLFEAALAKYGSPAAARRWVAAPGHSMHNHGVAADLKYLSPAARQWAHANASRFGLTFPLSNENWHVELAGARDGNFAPDLGGATVLTAALTPGAEKKRAAVSPAAARTETPLLARRIDEIDTAPSYASQVALFLATQHAPPERARDERTARYAQTRPLPGAWYHA
jgi:hypothetical protein